MQHPIRDSRPRHITELPRCDAPPPPGHPTTHRQPSGEREEGGIDRGWGPAFPILQQAEAVKDAKGEEQNKGFLLDSKVAGGDMEGGVTQGRGS
jgi:hypothetical protein